MRSWRRSGQILRASYLCSLTCCLSLALFLSSSSLFAAEPLRISSFNIQVLGQTKVKNPFVLKTIVQILSRYDMTFVQEIRDSERVAIDSVMASLNAAGSRQYALALSERLGRSISKEQYAFIYDPSKITLIEARTFVDSADEFEREPYIGRFRANGSDFSMIGIHVSPRAVAQELSALSQVYREVKNRWRDPDVLLLGDLNADCSYYDASRGFDFFDEPVYEVLPPGTDTNVAQANCSYDRVLAFGDIVPNLSQGKAYNFPQAFGLSMEEAKTVSDHYPVEFLLSASPSSPTPHKNRPFPKPPASSFPTVEDPLPPEVSIAEVSEVEPEGQPVAEAPSCGEDPYRTPRGYCYASFSVGKRRVSGSCCLAL